MNVSELRRYRVRPIPIPQRYHGTSTHPLLGLSVVLIIVISLALFAWFFTWYGSYPPEERTTLTLVVSNVDRRTVDNATCWDAVIEIKRMSPDGVDVRWKDLSVTIQSVTGSILETKMILAPDDPTAYDIGYQGTFNVEAWYRVDKEGAVKVRAWDHIVITGMSKDFEGAIVHLKLDGERVGGVTLPYFD